MPKRIIIAFLLGLVPAYASYAMSPQEKQEVTKLQWLYDADAKAFFEKDIKASRIRFFQYYGFTSVTPVVGDDPCYSWVEISPIEGTGDAILGSKHFDLIKRAQRFATEYNRLVKDHIDRAELRSCPQKPGTTINR